MLLSVLVTQGKEQELLGCPGAVVTSCSLAGVHHLRDGAVPNAGDGDQVGDLSPPPPAGSGGPGSQTALKRGDKDP